MNCLMCQSELILKNKWWKECPNCLFNYKILNNNIQEIYFIINNYSVWINISLKEIALKDNCELSQPSSLKILTYFPIDNLTLEQFINKINIQLTFS